MSQIVNWLNQNYLKFSKPHAIIPISGGISSACSALLCKKSNIPAVGLHVQFEKEETELVKNFCNENNLKLLTFNGQEILNGLEIKILDFDTEHKFLIYKKYLKYNFVSMIASSTANVLNASIISSFDKNKINFVRKINRLNDFSDFYPLGDLYKSEVLELYKHLSSRLSDEYFSTTKSIVNSKISDEDMGFTFSQEELEWADRENIKSNVFSGIGIINSDDSPINHPSRFWIGYNFRQKEIISKLNKLEKEIKNKEDILNICKLRNLAGTVI